MSLELIKNAIDSNGFQSDATAAGYINPEVWNKEVLKHVEAAMVLGQFGKVYNDLLGQAGDTLNVTVNAAPAAAAAVAESADVTIAAYAVTQVVFSPTEYAFAYALSDKEARRSFFDVQSNMAMKIGYALALEQETRVVSVLRAGNGNEVMVAGKTATSDLASSDTITYAVIVNAMTEIRKDYLVPRVLAISPAGLGQLMQLSQFSQAQQFGGRESILGGEIKTVSGLTIVWSQLITASSNKVEALMLGFDMSGEAPFGIARKSLPTIRTQRFELGRYTNIVGVHEYDVKVLRANGICSVWYYE